MTGDSASGSEARVQRLSSRLDTLLQKLDRLELKAGVTPADALAQRQLGILQRLERLEAACGVQPGPHAAAAHARGGAPAAPTAAVVSAAVEAEAEDGPGVSPVQARMAAQLRSRGVAPADVRWVRCPAEYYQQPLEYRVACLGAASTHHLTKIVVMVNTRAPAGVTDCSDQLVSKYYAVMVQYTSRLHTEKLNSIVYRRSQGGLAKKQVNLRLAPEDVSLELTGFGHNAVSPVGMATPIPLVMSHKIAALPGFFFMGGGEVDLKLGLRPSDFVEAYGVTVADITYEGEVDGDEFV